MTELMIVSKLLGRLGSKVLECIEQTIYDGTYGEFNIFSTRSIAQTFKPTENIVWGLKVWLKKENNPSNLKIEFWEGDPPSNKIKDVADVSPDEIGTEYAEYMFTFDDVEVTPGNSYAFVFKNAADYPNCYYWYHDADGSAYPDGNAYQSDDLTSWSDLERDMRMKVLQGERTLSLDALGVEEAYLLRIYYKEGTGIKLKIDDAEFEGDAGDVDDFTEYMPINVIRLDSSGKVKIIYFMVD